MYVSAHAHAEVCGGRGERISNRVGSVKPGESSQNCICIASILFFTSIFMDSAGRVKVLKAVGSTQPCQLTTLSIQSMSPRNITFRSLFPSVFLEPFTLSYPPTVLVLTGKE